MLIKKFTTTLWITVVHYRVQEIPSLVRIPSGMLPVDTHPSCTFHIHPALYTVVSSIQAYRPKLRPHVPSLPCALQPLAKSKFLKLLVTQFCKYFCDLTPLRFFYVGGGGGMTKDHAQICTTLSPNCIRLSAAVWLSHFVQFSNAYFSTLQSKVIRK
jgi:hypothetical protein